MSKHLAHESLDPSSAPDKASFDRNDSFTNREYGLSDLNWKDTGNEETDPSMRGYNEGYQRDPYQYQQWASRNELYRVKQGDTLFSIAANELKDANGWKSLVEYNGEYLRAHEGSVHPGHVIIIGKCKIDEEMKRSKTASDFLVTDYGYLPQQMAREFLTIWNGADSPIQDFFNGFVMNRFTDEMKEGMANQMREWGYEVTPWYTDRTPKYARKIKAKKVVALKNSYLKYVTAAESSFDKDDAQALLDYFKQIFPDSYAAELLKDAVNQVRQTTGRRVTLAEAGGLAEYYRAIYPDDYANALIDISLDKGPFMGFQEFIDLQLTNQDMDIIQKYDSENADPSVDMVRGPAGAEYGIGGNSFGWDPITDLRSDTGFPVSTYETTGMRIKDHRNLNGLKKNKLQR